MITAIQLISLFFAIWFTMVNMGKIYHGHPVGEFNFIIQAAATAVFVVVR